MPRACLPSRGTASLWNKVRWHTTWEIFYSTWLFSAFLHLHNQSSFRHIVLNLRDPSLIYNSWHMLLSRRRRKQLSASEPLHQWQTSVERGERERALECIYTFFIEPYLQGIQRQAKHSSQDYALSTSHTCDIKRGWDLTAVCISLYACL